MPPVPRMAPLPLPPGHSSGSAPSPVQESSPESPPSYIHRRQPGSTPHPFPVQPQEQPSWPPAFLRSRAIPAGIPARIAAVPMSIAGSQAPPAAGATLATAGLPPIPRHPPAGIPGRPGRIAPFLYPSPAASRAWSIPSECMHFHFLPQSTPFMQGSLPPTGFATGSAINSEAPVTIDRPALLPFAEYPKRPLLAANVPEPLRRNGSAIF